MPSLTCGSNHTAGVDDKGVKREDISEGVLDFQLNIRIGRGFRINERVVRRGFGGLGRGAGDSFLEGGSGYLKGAQGSVGRGMDK
ncbi:hypothetical protein Moror_12040 [Moniliophthora roreri MCA 2997]|uniref:Uncharacterized protein n=1 Tax=Moniliophthora roreri (strain MCA 2997) TaxID=1381753 RepID=V2WA13_MONRO|nr:hypothetical protein Moror_12040 [Moniliophthora roreri MCA 2997]